MTAVETVEYTVRRGDTLKKIARNAGFAERDWIRIYNASYNRRFRALRSDPDHILPGDRLNLPRYSPRDLTTIVLILTDTLVRLRRVSDRTDGLLRRVDRMQSAYRRSRDETEAMADDFRGEAEDLRDLAAEAASACEDAYSCAGAGAAAGNLENEARALDRLVRRLNGQMIENEKRFNRIMKELKAQLIRLNRTRERLNADVQRYANGFRAAARNPF